MAINFPDYPNPGDFHTVDQTTWMWDGNIWAIVPTNYAPNDLLPAQSGQAGKFLGTDGTTADWEALTPSAISLINTTTFTSASTVSLNDVFSGAFKDYQIRISNLSTSYIGKIVFRMRVAGSDNVTSTYWQASTYYGSSTTVNLNNMGTGFLFGNRYYYASPGYISDSGLSIVTMTNPFEASSTGWHGSSYTSNSYNINDVSVFGGKHSVASSFTGITFWHETNQPISGRVSVYGLVT